MRQKSPALIITFSTTTAAMAAEQFFTQSGLPGRLIPLPREISAGCGLCWKAPAGEEGNLTSRLTAAGLQWETERVIDI
jgi:hypothetical protein